MLYHTVQEFEAIGAVGVNYVKIRSARNDCGHMSGQRGVEAQEMQKKI